MFGYIVVNEQELKIREYRRYRSYYCGLCRTLREEFGRKGQLTLSYDMTFLVILLTGLYEPLTRKGKVRCINHPLGKQEVLQNECCRYAAEMNILLSYYKCMDDWDDEKRFDRYICAWGLHSYVGKVKKRYPKKAALIAEKLGKIRECEKRSETNPDIPAGFFGDIMAEILAWKQDEWHDELYRMGFYLGKFIYLLDAFDDREEDQKKKNYNVFLLRESMSRDPEFEVDPKQILTMMISECARTFERLPIVNDAEILRNILYSGVWTRYCARIEKEGKGNNGHESL